MTLGRVGIVGYGRFGRALGELVLRRGGSVVAFDPAVAIEPALRASDLKAIVGASDVLVVATPVDVMPAVFAELDPLLATKDAPLVIDVGSVKLAPAQAFANAFGDRHRFVGTHPLFGPTSLALAERPLRVVVCPAQKDADTVAAERFWQTLGCETERISAEEHDRVMARTHALAFFFAKGMVDGHLATATTFAPPSFQALSRSIDAVRADAGHLFRTIEVDNPFAAEARSTLLRALAAADAELTHATSISEIASPSGDTATRAAPPALTEARELIDSVDRELVRLLARRAELADRVARAKEALHIPTRDPVREAAVFASRKEWAQEVGLDADAVADVFAAILRFSRAHQNRA